ncbi:MAG: methyl-accepting chemotaxis protein [Planctomycetes bacterium]|nr:methyl-accepting chemotaxis protein [Planctomycetota bacterium]
MANHSRRKQLIKPGSQLRIIAYAVLVALVALLLNLSLLIFGLESAFSAVPGADPELQDGLRLAVLKYSLFSAGLVVPLATCLGVVVSFQIFGPVYRFEQFVEQMANGDLSKDCRLRRGDDLGGLESKINAMVARMRDDFQRDREALAEIIDGLDAIEPLVPETQRGRVASMRKLAEEAIEEGPCLEAETEAEAETEEAPVETTTV